jgi:LCP family protein required for cell wall assembly
MKKKKGFKLKKKSFWRAIRITGIVALLFQMIMSGILMIEFVWFPILPTKYMLLLALVLVIGLVPSLLLLLIRDGKKGLIPGILWAILWAAACFLAIITYIEPARKTVENITGVEASETYHIEGVSVIVRIDNPAKRLKDTDGYTYGIQTAEEYAPMLAAYEHIASTEKISLNLKEYDYYTNVAAALMSGEIQAMLSDTSYVDMLAEYAEGFDGNYRILEELSFDAEIPKSAAELNMSVTPTPFTAPIEDPDVTPDPSKPTEAVTPTPIGYDAVPTPVIPMTAMPARSSAENITGDYYTVYFSGIDCYGGITAQSRSDVNIIMVVNPKTHKILLVNTPRDSYVLIPDISGNSFDKLTHAGVYGVKASMKTLERVYGITLDYYVRVNFSSVERIVDYLWGVDVYSPYAFDSSDGIHSYGSGMNHMSGASALAFARERNNIPGGDFQRGRNQMEVIKGVINKMQSPAILNSFTSIMEAVSGNFQTNLTYEQLAALCRSQLDSGASWTVETYAISCTGTYGYCFSYKGEKLYVGQIDWDTAREAARKMRAVMAGE